MRKTDNTIIVPTYDEEEKKPCTAMFDIHDMKWKRVTLDNRIGPNGGQLLSIANDSKILYLGGFDQNRNKLNTIFELIEDKYWKLWSAKLPVPIGNDTIITMPPSSIKKVSSFQTTTQY